MAPKLKGSRLQTRLDGRLVVVTGANCGIGKETARDLAARGARVIILCRNIKKGESAAKDIFEATPGAIVEVQMLDLASLRSVRACAEHLLGTEDRIDVLVNNAGVVSPKALTEDGFEMNFGTNHLGHFLLTELLMPLLKKSSETDFKPRIVIVSSLAHRSPGRLQWEDLNWEKTQFHKFNAYGASKLANVLHAKELARRLKEEGSNISVYVLHPGLVKTEVFRHASGSLFDRLIGVAASLTGLTPLEGAQTTIFCCVAESIANESGKYYDKCREARVYGRADKEDDAKRLWKISEEMVGTVKSA